MQSEPRGMPMQYRRGNCILLFHTNYRNQTDGRTHSLSDYIDALKMSGGGLAFIECNRQSALSLEVWSHVAKLISF